MKVLAFLFFVCACSSLVRQGAVFDNGYNEIKEGITHKQNVEQMLGAPSVEIDENTWLYYSYYINKYGIRKSKIEKEEILLLTFDEDGITKSKRYEERINQGISIDKKYLEYRDSEKQNLLKELFKDPIVMPK